ncbi:protein translocase subunit SecF [uncultured Clostridium sp.]|uniref:protein translocase subunit SecF n=1 Tax=uncultured Clostridium sp. TaxID=59620 RepID=UPI0025CDD316|nr:protein translocase subunit SecF [uncultured Clostridium sp.]
MKVIERTKIWFTISLVVILIGIGSMLFKGFNFGIDFKGGTLVEISMGKELNDSEIKEVTDIIKKQDSSAVVTTANNNSQVDVKAGEDTLTEAKLSTITKNIQEKFSDAKLKSHDRIGSTVGKELTQKAILSSLISIVLILVYVGFRFEFKFGCAAVIALIHDILVTLSVYSVFSITVDSPFIAAMLTVLGYSINDTIVVFDRIRENLKKMRKKTIEEIADESINQTIKRSLYTSITTLITITTITIMVPAIRNFGIPLIIGIASGAYSSIFIASPLWVLFKKHSKKKVKI